MKRSMTNEERLELLEKLVDDAFTIINCYMLSPGVEVLRWMDRAIKYDEEQAYTYLASLRDNSVQDDGDEDEDYERTNDLMDALSDINQILGVSAPLQSEN